MEYIYDAMGNKLAKKLNNAVVNYYAGSIVYKGTVNKEPEYILHPEGIALYGGTGFAYQYNLTDHLGNVRSVLATNKTVEQTTDSFPFGLAHATANLGKNKYLYNGKELQNDNIGGTAFSNLDYGARFYDPTIARWNVIDPLAEKYYGLSPYNYVANNPMRFIDPDGRDIWQMDRKGNIEWLRKEDKHFLFARGEDGSHKSLEIKNRDILDQLSTYTEVPKYTSEGYIQDMGLRRTAVTGTEDANDMANLFSFAAKNSDVEWVLDFANVNGEKKYGIGTYGLNSFAPGNLFGTAKREIIGSIHSHPNPTTKNAEIESLHGDRGLSVGRSFPTYVYMSKSSNIYLVQKGKINFMQKAKDTYNVTSLNKLK